MNPLDAAEGICKPQIIMIFLNLVIYFLYIIYTPDSVVQTVQFAE